MSRESIGAWCARAIVAVLAGGLIAIAQPLPEIHDVYSTEPASQLGPQARSTALDRWSATLRGASFVRYDFRLRIEDADWPPTEASGRAELMLDAGRTVDFRVVLAEDGTSLVPAGTALARVEWDATARMVDPDRPTGPLDRIARYVSDLPLPGPDDPPATELSPSVLHFPCPAADEHIYLYFVDDERFPVKIARITDGPTRVVLDIERVAIE